jgi:hypothetical protein
LPTNSPITFLVGAASTGTITYNVAAGDKVMVTVNGIVARTGSTNAILVYFFPCYQDSGGGTIVPGYKSFFRTDNAPTITSWFSLSNSATFSFSSAGTFLFGACAQVQPGSDALAFRYVNATAVRFH